MTSEAPQDVAALPQTEAGKRLWKHWTDMTDSPTVDLWWRQTILAIEREATAGLLDQNDRLREALETWRSVAERRLAVGTPPDWETLLPMTVRVLRGSGAEEAARDG